MRTRHPIVWLKEHPRAADLLLGLVVMAIVLPSQWQTPVDSDGVVYRDPDLFGIVLGLLSSVPVIWRRRSPLVVLTIAGTGAALYEMVGYPTVAAPFGLLVALYTVGAHCDRRASRIAAGITGVALGVVLVTARWEVTIGNFASNVIIFGTFWLIGDNLQTRRAYVASLHERAERAEATRIAEAERAVTEERTRIARELHDVVAHSMSVMVVQAAAARRVLGTDPVQAADALQAIEATGRDALVEMRRLLGVLREDGGSASLAPQPSLRELPSLIAHVAESGLAVTLATEGTPRDLPAVVGLSAFRIVQEALTNALKHAGPSASAVITVRYRDDEVEIEVADDGRGAGAGAAAPANGSSGHGLLGMRERAGLFGGELTAGPRAGGGFVVRARLPLPEAAVG
ncbi:MAG: histidine kinase [Acidimicrobiales bacterium]